MILNFILFLFMFFCENKKDRFIIYLGKTMILFIIESIIRKNDTITLTAIVVLPIYFYI
jgi:hypothetical protein